MPDEPVAHAGRCTVAYWHHPLFSSSVPGGSPGVRPLWKTLYAHGADVVLGGHDHHYERMAQRDPSGSRTASGIRSFVVGTGGRSLAAFPPMLSAASEAHDDKSFGVLFLTLHAGSYDWAFRREDGSVADSGSAACHSAAPPPAPATPPPAPPPPPVVKVIEPPSSPPPAP